MVPEIISSSELKVLRNVLKRKPVLWDNLHANDYDIQRVYLGPFDGRNVDILQDINGVLLNPNCEYSTNVPALFTLGLWAQSQGNYDPLEASRRAIPEFLREIHRSTHVGNFQEYLPKRNDKSAMEISEKDIELLFHLFWLPYSHGPLGDCLLEEFTFLRDHVHLIKVFEVDEDDESLVEEWLMRATHFNGIVRDFNGLCDKLSFIENRQLFFDLNPYINNVQVILSACNRILKWQGRDQCRKPITGGPTLVKLPGGFAGDLARLYPIRHNDEYPVVNLDSLLERRSVISKPVPFSKISEIAQSLSVEATPSSSTLAFVIIIEGVTKALLMGNKETNIIGFHVERELLFTGVLTDTLDTLMESLDQDSKEVTINLRLNNIAAKQYLIQQNFKKVGKTEKCFVLKKSVPKCI